MRIIGYNEEDINRVEELLQKIEIERGYLLLNKNNIDVVLEQEKKIFGFVMKIKNILF